MNIMQMRRGMGAHGGGILPPAGYTRIQYVQNTSNSYINTGLSFVGNHLQMLYSHRLDENNSANYSFCVLQDGTSHRCGSFEVAANCYALGGGDQAVTISNIRSAINLFLSFDYNIYNNLGNANLKVGDNLVVTKSFTAGTANNTYKFHVFCKNNTGTIQQPMKCAVEYLKFIIDDKVERDFVPYKDPNNVAGLWDMVYGVFYPSSNSTPLVAGPDVQ